MAAQGQFEENGIFYIQNDDDYKTVRVSFNNEHRYVGDITIPSSVTHNDKTYKVSKIGRHAFRYCRNLKTVTIPNGVTVIEICAFAECDNLTTVTIPNSVKAIGDYAFYKCNSLSTIIIPNGVNSIGKYAFWGCNNLTAVTIPNSVKSIGDQAFYNCKKLASIEMPNSNVEIGDFAFPQNTNALLKSNATRDSNPVGVKAKGVYTIKDRLKTTYLNGTDKQEDTLYSGIYKVTDKKGEQVFFKLSTSANGDRTVRIKYVFKNGKTPNNNGIEYSYWGKWNVEELGGKKVLSLKKDKEKEILKPLWISFYGIGAMEEHSIVYMRFLNKTNIILFINDDDKTSLGMLKISETPENSVADETKEKQIILQNKQKVQQQRIEKANNIAEGKRKAPGEYEIKDKIKTVFLKLDTDGKVYFKYNGTCLGKQYQNDSYVYWGTWQIENSAIEGNKIKMEQDMRNFQRWLHIYFPCSGLIEMMQQYSSLVIFMKDGKIYGGRCNTPLQTVKIQ